MREIFFLVIEFVSVKFKLTTTFSLFKKENNNVQILLIRITNLVNIELYICISCGCVFVYRWHLCGKMFEFFPRDPIACSQQLHQCQLLRKFQRKFILCHNFGNNDIQKCLLNKLQLNNTEFTFLSLSMVSYSLNTIRHSKHNRVFCVHNLRHFLLLRKFSCV